MSEKQKQVTEQREQMRTRSQSAESRRNSTKGQVEKERRGVDDCLHYLFSLTGKRLYISSLSVAQLISVYSEGRSPRDYQVSRGGHQKSNEEITAVVRDLQHRFNIIDFTAKDIDAALKETGADIEEDDGEHQSSVQFVLAKKQKCLIVVTNNYKDYRFLQGIEVLRPAKIRKIPQ